MSWRVLQSSWRFGRAATRVLVWKQSQGVKIEGTRGLFSSVRLCADDKVTHTGQVSGPWVVYKTPVTARYTCHSRNGTMMITET